MSSLYLLASLAGREIVIPATHVESVVKVHDIVPVPAVSPQICGLFALRSRVLTLVDCCCFVEGHKCGYQPGQLAIVATIDGHHYGLLVDAVHDIITSEEEPIAATGDLGQGWSTIGNEMVSIDDGRLVLVMDITNVVNPSQPLAA
ncbi:MAG: chemotaxis protein CheW [Pseudomonadota bacterium]